MPLKYNHRRKESYSLIAHGVEKFSFSIRYFKLEVSTGRLLWETVVNLRRTD